MIATKTTALMLALGMLGIAGMMFASPSVYAQSNTAVANNEDNDVVLQENSAKIEQSQKVSCEAENESGDVALNIAANECDENTQSQSATVAQANVNEDNDVQIAEAEAQQSVCGQLALLGLQVCGNVD
jgi:hypothetical protein